MSVLSLAERELQRYNIEAELKIEKALPSFELRCSSGTVVIAAPDELELLYGVYDFAERFGGWNFFEVGVDRFDESRRCTVFEDGILYPARKPLLKRRGFIQEFPFDGETPILFDWMAKNKLNYLLVWMKYYDHLSDELKQQAAERGIEIESGHHNFDYWIPGKKYAGEHPEFFAEINGARISPSGNAELLLSEQLCTTNPELRAEIVRRMDAYCEAHPEVKTISLIPNDGFGWCECSECSKFYDKNHKGDFYSLSEHVYKADRIYHDLLRDVAARLRKVRPEVQLTFCAYVNYCAPSEGFTLEPGMAVHMATYWRCINHRIDEPGCYINSSYASDIRAWCRAKRGGEVNIYEYFMGINFYLSLPMLHFDEMFHEMSCYSQWGVDGILTQFHIGHWSVYGVNYRFMAQAARGEDCAGCQERFYREMFGADAGAARSFYGNIKHLLLTMGRCHIPYPHSLFRRTKLEQFRELLDEAAALCAKAPGDRFRQDLVIWMEYLCRFKEFYDCHAAGKATPELAAELLNWIHSHRDSRVFVHLRFDIYFDSIKKQLEQGHYWLHFGLPWEDEYIRRQEKILD